MIEMKYIYYVSCIYLDRLGKEKFGDVVYPYAGGIRTEKDIKDIAAMLRMHYDTKHLRILSFSAMRRTDTYENLKNMFKDFLFEFFSAPRMRQKLRVWRKQKRKNDVNENLR